MVVRANFACVKHAMLHLEQDLPVRGLPCDNSDTAATRLSHISRERLTAPLRYSHDISRDSFRQGCEELYYEFGRVLGESNFCALYSVHVGGKWLSKAAIIE